MPRRTILSESQRKTFEIIPTDSEILTRYYTFSEEDLQLINQRRKSYNRLGFAIVLCLIRFPGRALKPEEPLENEFIEYVAKQIRVNPNQYKLYSKRDETRREHLKILLKAFNISTLSKTLKEKLVNWLVPIAIDNPKGVFLVGALLNQMRSVRILHPTLQVIEEIASQSLSLADQKVYSSIANRLNEVQIQLLDSWIIIPADQTKSTLAWIKEPAGRFSPKNINSIIEKLVEIDKIELSESIIDSLSLARISNLSREAAKSSIQHLRDLSFSRRYSILIVYLIEIKKRLIDDAVNMHDKIMGSLASKSKRKLITYTQQKNNATKQTVKMFCAIGQLIIDARNQNTNPLELIDKKYDWNDFDEMVEIAEDLSKSQKNHHLFYITSNYSNLRIYIPNFIEYFDFKSTTASVNLIEAVKTLRKMNLNKERKLPDNIPISFIPKSWKAYIFQENQVNRQYYELCVISQLKDMLRSGDVWITGSKQYKDFDSYLLGKNSFLSLLDSDDLPLVINTNFEEFISKKKEQLNDKLEKLNRLIQKSSEIVKIKNNRLSISPYKGDVIPEEAKIVLKKIYDQIPRIKITSLLLEVDQWTNFSQQFTHLKNGLPAKNRKDLLTVLLSEGINLGLSKMAEACQETSVNKLRRVYDWYISNEGYSKALAEIVNYHTNTELVTKWGDGSTSSSDGQQFPLGGAGKAIGSVNIKYGFKPRVVFYTHISDQYSPFYSNLISSTDRDAPYVLDGLLYHETDLNIKEHYTDTSGYTDHVFALCHLLGFRFAPRIRNFGKLNLYSIDSTKQWENIHSLFGKAIKEEHMRAQWKDILRLSTSIKLGNVTASLIIKKLASYPLQNKLALALKELGKLERTLYLLDWVLDPKLRKKVQVGLNKGESRNALARAVYFNRQGEIRDRSFEGQFNKESGLNLIVTAIILWNTVYLEKGIEKLREKMKVPDEYLKFLSPLGWDHINLTGDYVWENP